MCLDSLRADLTSSLQSRRDHPGAQSVDDPPPRRDAHRHRLRFPSSSSAFGRSITMKSPAHLSPASFTSYQTESGSPYRIMIKSNCCDIEYGIRQKNDTPKKIESDLENIGRSWFYRLPFLFKSFNGTIYRDGTGTRQRFVMGDSKHFYRGKLHHCLGDGTYWSLGLRIF